MIRGGILRGPAPLSHPNTPPPSAFPRKNSPSTPPSSGISAKKLAQHARKRRFWAIFRALGELFRARTHTRPSRANFFAHEARQHSDIETNNTTARPQTATIETGNTTATEKCPKNAHFAPAKATTVSVEARPAPAKATGVSDNRPSWPTGPGGDARGRRRGLAGRPVGGRRYKRRQTNAIQIASRGPL